jgi:hypothetical protein
MRSTFLLATTLSAFLGFACESLPTTPGDPAPPSASPITPASVSPSGCPTDEPAHSSPCSTAGLRCEWDFRIVGKVSAFCDGHLWRVARRDNGCPATIASGDACGQFAGSCSYLDDGVYPTGGQPRPDVCVRRCDCYSGKWSCTDSCSCPGNKTSDPFREGFDDFEFGRGCLHSDMQCDYAFEVGKQETGDGVAAQPCQTSYTCAGTAWKRVNMCACPAFKAGQRSVSLECHSDSKLQCSFPPNFEGGPSRSCRCEDELWSCQ